MKEKRQYKKIILVDLEGVLNEYSDDFQENFILPPKKGVKEFLEILCERFIVFIFTTHPAPLAKAWLKSNNLITYIEDVTNNKIPAYLHIDDRAICHNGDFDETLNNIENFKVHWQL